jgi:hypothetical protein
VRVFGNDEYFYALEDIGKYSGGLKAIYLLTFMKERRVSTGQNSHGLASNNNGHCWQLLNTHHLPAP